MLRGLFLFFGRLNFIIFSTNGTISDLVHKNKEREPTPTSFATVADLCFSALL